jgi:hypothetical protein
MFAKRFLYLAPVSGIVFHRKAAYASQSPVMKSNYRDRFEQLNKEDTVLIIERYKSDLSKNFGYPHIIAGLDNDIVEHLHYVLALYTKPLSPERKISLRKYMLPHLEKSEGETLQFFEHLLTYYGAV